MGKFDLILDAFGVHSGLLANLPLICRLAGRGLGDLTVPMCRKWFGCVPEDDYMTRACIALHCDIGDLMIDALNRRAKWSVVNTMLMNCMQQDKWGLIMGVVSMGIQDLWIGRKIVLSDRVHYVVSIYRKTCLRDDFAGASDIRIRRYEMRKNDVKVIEWSGANGCDDEGCTNCDRTESKEERYYHTIDDIPISLRIYNSMSERWRASSAWLDTCEMIRICEWFMGKIRQLLIRYCIPVISEIIIQHVADKTLRVRWSRSYIAAEEVLAEPLPCGWKLAVY
jgi:hypothetical protein